MSNSTPESDEDGRPGDKCKTCNGTGSQYEDHGDGAIENLGCHDCRATGLVQDPAADHRCGVCLGTGRTRSGVPGNPCLCVGGSP